MICPNCKTENRSNAKFCDECGTRLDAPVHEHKLEVSQIPEVFSTKEHAVQEPENAASGLEETAAPETPAPEEPDNAAAEEQQTPFAEDADEEPAEDADAGEEAPETEGEDAASGAEEAEEPEQPEEQPDSAAREPLPMRPIAEKFSIPTVEAADTMQIPAVGEPPEMLVSGYHLPDSAWQPSNTLEMPAINAGDEPANKVFSAPDSTDKKALRAQKKEQRRQQRESQKRARQAAKNGGPKVPMGTGKKVFLGVCAVAVVAAAGVGIGYYLQLWGGKVIPNVEGLAKADAVYLLENEGFTVRSDEVASDDVEGLVLMSDPSSGQRAEEGSEVVVHVSVSRTIPKIKGKSRDEAVKILADAGYTNIGKDKTKKSDSSEGDVVAVSPKQGAKAVSTETITLTISEYYRVPDVVGKKEADAVEAIEDAGYKAEVHYKTDKDTKAGYVISTDPKADKRKDSGSTIKVYVCISREDQLIAAAKKYLTVGKQIELTKASYTIVSLDSVSYKGDDQVSFTITGQPFTEFLGQTVYLEAQSASGILTFEEGGTDVIAVD